MTGTPSARASSASSPPDGRDDAPGAEHAGGLVAGQRLLGVARVARAEHRRVGRRPRRQPVGARRSGSGREAWSPRIARASAPPIAEPPMPATTRPPGLSHGVEAGRLDLPQRVAQVLGDRQRRRSSRSARVDRARSPRGRAWSGASGHRSSAASPRRSLTAPSPQRRRRARRRRGRVGPPTAAHRRRPVADDVAVADPRPGATMQSRSRSRADLAPSGRPPLDARARADRRRRRARRATRRARPPLDAAAALRAPRRATRAPSIAPTASPARSARALDPRVHVPSRMSKVPCR